ncbi:hypothetical protein C5167_040261 [Papaver somniferum]|uniref:Uncharacterized protein n=1 Tax=Papaver somniferum TaxID=3469 RepID=A0A4Y7IEE6_PAPSO|nr:hypothetical protein C5167_040261 [Papaver somniferum]
MERLRLYLEKFLKGKCLNGIKKNVFQSGKKHSTSLCKYSSSGTSGGETTLEEEADAGFPTSTESRLVMLI